MTRTLQFIHWLSFAAPLLCGPVVWCGLASSACGQVVPLEVRSCVAGRSCQVGRCSAVVVGKRGEDWIVVSAGHCFRDEGHQASVQLGIDGRWHPARLLSFSVTNTEDLAVIAVEYPGELRSAPLFGSSSIESGEPVSVKAFAGGQSYRERAACFLSAEKDWLTVSGMPLEGESGGGVFANDQLLAIIKGHPAFGEMSTIGTNSNRIRRFLLESLGSLPVVPGPIAQRPEGADKRHGGKDQPASPGQEPSDPHVQPSEIPLDAMGQLADRIDRLGRAINVALAAAKLAGYVGLAGSGLGSLALVIPAIGGVRRWLRRKAARKKTDRPRDDGRDEREDRQSPPVDRFLPIPRDLDETRELLQLRQQENRVAPLDALRGVLIDDELEHDIEGTDRERSDWAQSLKRRLDERVNEIAPVSTQ